MRSNVVREWRGRAIATRLHAELRAVRPEPRFTLLVDPDSEANARRLYLSWGYQMVARLQPAYNPIRTPRYTTLSSWKSRCVNRQVPGSWTVQRGAHPAFAAEGAQEDSPGQSIRNSRTEMACPLMVRQGSGRGC